MRGEGSTRAEINLRQEAHNVMGTFVWASGGRDRWRSLNRSK